MVPSFLTLLLLTQPAGSSDTASPFATPLTRQIIERAMARGRRFRTRDPDWDFSSVFYRPWFVPRGVGDSVRLFSDNFPATGALHPLASSGPDWYGYALRDSITVATPGGDRVRIYVVDVTPRGTGPAPRDSARVLRTRSWNYADRWPGGRYELHRPPNDSLARYAAWDDSLELGLDDQDRIRLRDVATTLAHMSDTLPDELTGARAGGFGYERLADALRYDRVQGYSLGLGYHIRVPGLEFTTLQATVRYGFSDERVTGRLSLIRDAPGGRFRLSGYREVASVDPIGRGPSIGNTLNAIFAAHDDADYALVTGGSASFETSVGVGWELTVSGRVERERSVIAQASSGVNDFLGGQGIFPPNPPITEGTFAGGTVQLGHTGRTRWALTADVLGGAGTTTVRGWGELRQDVGGKAGLTFRAKAGIASTPVLPQSAFRLGGLNTVRGFDYGTLVGQAFWAGQLDVAPLPGRIRPVLFVDAGQAGSASGLFSTQALVGAGAGLSFFRGALRFDVSRRLSPDVARLRFDLVVGAVR